MTTSHIDLLRPSSALDNYRNQIKHTIDAYSVPHIAIGEALQNALDAIAVATTDHNLKAGSINVEINFDTNTVTISDNGIGFPNNVDLLILGGSGKPRSSKTVSGMVGVGIKVVLYCAEHFSIKSRTKTGAWALELNNAHKFKDDLDLQLEIPVPFNNDATPRDSFGTVVSYRFPEAEEGTLFKFMEAVRSRIVDPQVGAAAGFPGTVKSANTPNQPAYLLASFLQRYSYVGDTLEMNGGRPGLANTKITITLKSKSKGENLGQFWKDCWGDNDTVSITINPHYLSVEQTTALTKIKQPAIFEDALGHGGTGLSRTASGFNVTKYLHTDDYKKLLRNKKGELPPADELARFEKRLFPKINCIKLTIGRIPQLNQYLPHGSRRVLSANGVVTEHDLEIVSGRNQQYVRCVDLVIDLDAELNYGKTQITNGPLVGLAREFVNEAYRRTIQDAAAAFVGKIVSDSDDEPMDQFWARPNMSPSVVAELRKQPRDENDVIALFAALISTKQLNGYLVYGFSQSDRYDSRMIVHRECDPPNLLDNPQEKDLRTVEFKVSASSIIRDIESDAKDIGDMHLLIAWDQGSMQGTRFSLESIEHSNAYKSSPKKVFSGAMHYLNDNKSGKQLQVLLLRHFIDKKAVPA